MLSSLDSTFWLTGPVIFDPAIPFLHHIPVLKYIATRINILWAGQSRDHSSNGNQAQEVTDDRLRNLLAMSMILALRFSRVVLLQLTTHPRYRKRVHAAVLRPLVLQASKFLLQVEQHKADGSVLFQALQVAESMVEPVETVRDEKETTDLPAVASDLVLEIGGENTEDEAIRPSDIDILMDSYLPQEPTTSSSVNLGEATAHSSIATQIRTLPHPILSTPTEAKEESPSADTASPPWSKSIDDQATIEKGALQTLVSLASLSARGDRQDGSSASTLSNKVSSLKSLSTVSDTPEPLAALEAPLSSPSMSLTTPRPSYLRSAVERQRSIRRGLEADPYLITSSTAKLELAIREANRQIERGRQRSGSASSNQLSNASTPLPSASFKTHIPPAELDVDEMARKIADVEYMSAMRVEWDIAREIADRKGIFPKAKSTTSLSSAEHNEPFVSGHSPRVATESVNDVIMRRSYSSAAADRPSIPKKETSRSASTTTVTRKSKMSFAESAGASSVRFKTSLCAPMSPATPHLSSPSSSLAPRFGARLLASPSLSSPSSPKVRTLSESSLATPAKPPRIHRLCMQAGPETPSKKSPWEQRTDGGASPSTTNIAAGFACPRKGSVSSLISSFEHRRESSETIKDPPHRYSFSTSTLSLHPRPVSFYASLGSMPGPSTSASRRTIPFPVTVSRPLPTPPVRTPRMDSQKRQSSSFFRAIDKSPPVHVPMSTSDNGDTDSVVSDIYEDDDDETVDLIRVATQSSVASSSSYLHSRRYSIAVPSTLASRRESEDQVKVKEDEDDNKSNASEVSLQFLDVPDPLAEEWIQKNGTRTSLSHKLSTSGSVKSSSAASEQEQQQDDDDDDDDDDEPLGNHPSQRAWNALTIPSMVTGSTSSIIGGLGDNDSDDNDMSLVPPSPAFMAPFTWAQSRSPTARSRMDGDISRASYNRRIPGSGSEDRTPSTLGRRSRMTNTSIASSTSTQSLLRFGDEENEVKASSRDGSPTSPSYRAPWTGRWDRSRARHASERGPRVSLNVKDADDVRRLRR